ncbi:ABC transporter ATP-binding protein [Thalassotalea sp. PP2-459]|uniref:ABC transporter ATP-binding protein n=1 Tax=Thalassotalea sp. PP2-459 TaxID=1742724 RepID=UPI0009452464|nr:ABC transporter ATP-binding protein [Thalassotalea sp. PP2-459]OKY25665.1 multidrug ABC transporter ATP-binding protein [Thalassotalea sp. PP2-459]
MAQENSLSIQQVDKSYAGKGKALNKITMEITNGMFGLLGPNGAGKSTLMRSIATLQPIDSGKILFNGYDISHEPNRIRKVLGYLPQEFGVYPKVSAEVLLHYLGQLKGITNKKERQKQIDYLLERTNLSHHRKQAVEEYSGGMRQRFGIAQALLANPKILIVDEPTAGLDPQECHSLHNLLCELSDAMIVIFSTHIVEDIQNLCRDMAVLDNGQLRFIGSPQALINPLSNRLWQAEMSSENAAQFSDDFHVLSTRFIGGRCQVRLLAQESPAGNFSKATPDLQDGYFHLLKQAI